MRTSIVRVVSVLVGSTCLILATTQCTITSSGRDVDQNGTVTQTVGPQGGTVDSADGTIVVDIPAGALTSDVAITVATATAPTAGNLGTAFEIGPTGTQFAVPVTMTFHYGSIDLGDKPETSLRVATVTSGQWTSLSGFTEDTTAKTVGGTTMHLSPYGIIAAAGICVNVSASPECTGSTDAGAAPDSSADAAPDDAGAGDPFDCIVPTCATAGNICAKYPGSVVSCTDSAEGMGYTASCCFPDDQPVCETFSEGEACAASDAGAAPDAGDGVDSGGGGGGCSTLTCATSPNACGSLAPGSTQNACTDLSDNGGGGSGISVTCCWPAGTVPPNASDGGVATDDAGTEDAGAAPDASADAGAGN